MNCTLGNSSPPPYHRAYLQVPFWLLFLLLSGVKVPSEDPQLSFSPPPVFPVSYVFGPFSEPVT